MIARRPSRIDSGDPSTTNVIAAPINGGCRSTGAYYILMVAIALIFLLGIGNFAMHRAVLDSGHPLLGQVPWFVHLLGGRITFATEFLMLLAALLLAASGLAWIAAVYLGYTLLNAVGAWLILSGRI